MTRPTHHPIRRPEEGPYAAAPAWRARPLLASLLLVALVACGAPAAPGEPTPTPTPTPTPEPDRDITLEAIADGFTQPLGVVAEGSELYVMEQPGTVRVVRDGAVLEDPFLDLTSHADFTTGGEQGLLGMAFHPDPEVDAVFVHYSDADGDTAVSRMEIVDGQASLATEERILDVDQPDQGPQHNGGQLTFGPDGMLYLALGDGGTGGAPAGDPGDPLGSILRMDVDADDLRPGDAGTRPNPAAADAAYHPLVWHYGLRNPWRFSFDPDTDDLWIADVGEQDWEEVNRVEGNAEAGLDFGWPAMEGEACYAIDPCDEVDARLPDLTYETSEEGWGRSITGGYVYRGEAIPGLQGAYVFGDFISGAILAADVAEDAVQEPTLLLDTDHMIASLGVDAEGEILVLDYAEGSLHRIVPAP